MPSNRFIYIGYVWRNRSSPGEYQTRPDVDLSTVENVQQVRAVWASDEWELHFVCKVEIEMSEEPGEQTVGVDLGINNFAALAYEDGHSEVYPLNCLKQDDYYFSKRIARCDDSDSEQATRLHEKKSARRIHYFHTLSKHIVQRCVDEGVGTIVVGDLSGIREDEENSEAKDWGKHGNLDLHSWTFDRFTDLRRSCLTRKLVRSHLKNTSRRKPQYPNAGILALQGGEDVNVRRSVYSTP